MDRQNEKRKKKKKEERKENIPGSTLKMAGEEQLSKKAKQNGEGRARDQKSTSLGQNLGFLFFLNHLI